MPRSPCRGPLTVLVVDDRPDVADSLALFLRACCGHDAVVAYDGEAGVRVALERRPDAVVCDLGLPGRTGFEVAEALRRGLPDRTLLVALTAYEDEAVRGRARWAGFDHFLVKPADPREVDAIVGGAARAPGGPAA
jgi:two-component system, chemotaxis family, CheB/CheR fusion protein